MAIKLGIPPVMAPFAVGGDPPSKEWVAWFQAVRSFTNQSNIILDQQRSTTAASEILLTSNITDKFIKYRIDCVNLTFSAATSLLQFQVSTDGGVTYKSGASDYKWGLTSNTLTTVPTDVADMDTADSKIQLCTTDNTNDANNVLNGYIDIYNPCGGSNYTMVTWSLYYNTASADLVYVQGAGSYLANTAVNALRIFPSSGNVTGKFTLTGIN